MKKKLVIKKSHKFFVIVAAFAMLFSFAVVVSAATGENNVRGLRSHSFASEQELQALVEHFEAKFFASTEPGNLSLIPFDTLFVIDFEQERLDDLFMQTLAQGVTREEALRLRALEVDKIIYRFLDDNPDTVLYGEIITVLNNSRRARVVDTLGAQDIIRMALTMHEVDIDALLQHIQIGDTEDIVVVPNDWYAGTRNLANIFNDADGLTSAMITQVSSIGNSAALTAFNHFPIDTQRQDAARHFIWAWLLATNMDAFTATIATNNQEWASAVRNRHGTGSAFNAVQLSRRQALSNEAFARFGDYGGLPGFNDVFGRDEVMDFWNNRVGIQSRMRPFPGVMTAFLTLESEGALITHRNNVNRYTHARTIFDIRWPWHAMRHN